MTDRGHVYRPGEDPLEPRPMTEEQRRALMDHVRSAQDLLRRQAAVERWQRNPAHQILSDAAVVEIREARGTKESLASLARRFGVSRTAISRISRGITRRNSGGPVQPKGVYASRQPLIR